MALSDDLRKRVVEAVVVDGLSRNKAAKLFKVSIVSAVRWVKHFEITGDISPLPCGGDRGTVRNLVCGVIVEPLEADYGDQEEHT